MTNPLYLKQNENGMWPCPKCGTEYPSRDKYFGGSKSRKCYKCAATDNQVKREEQVRKDRREREVKKYLDILNDPETKKSAFRDIRYGVNGSPEIKEYKREAYNLWEKKNKKKVEEARQGVVRADPKKKINVAERELAQRKLAAQYLLPFVLRMESEYLPGWVHKDICARLEKFEQDIRDKKSPRLMLQMPPRAGKSQLASVNFPAWFLGRNPTMEVMAATYSGSLALGFSRKVRQVIREPRFQNVFKTRLDKESQNAEGWFTTKGGGYIPAGVGGALTGMGAHALIIDDPVKNSEEAESAVTRESIKGWYSSTAYTRLAPGGGVLCIQTRWHEDDLSGWLETQMENGDGDQWEIVRYPAIAMEDEKYRKKGEALHPERYDIDALRRIEKAVGPRVWDALYQQHPVLADGTYFTKEMIKYYSGSPPQSMHTYSAWDLAIGKNERNDWTVGITVGVDIDDNIWVLDLRRGRWDSYQIVEEMLDIYRTYKPEVIGVEKGQLSLAIGPYLEERIAEERAYEMYVKDMQPGRRDKESRARAIQGRLRQGKVYFPNYGDWVDNLVKEMLAFPLGKHDDQVDALAYIGLLLQDMIPPAELKKPDPYEKGWRSRFKTQLTMSRGKSPMRA
jgi:predicted phage terminase large subunit-like protein